MLPLSPVSAYTRSPTFIDEEWAAYFSDASFVPARNVSGGWRGVLYGNLACISPRVAWNFFSQEKFDMSWIDGGASRTWYLAFSAGEQFPDEMERLRSLLKCTCSTRWNLKWYR